MLSKNIKIFGVVLVVLAIVYFASDLIDNKQKRNFKKYLVELNKEDVQAFKIYSKNYSQTNNFIFEEDKWYIADEDKKYIADEDKINRLMDDLKHLKTKALASRNDSLWENYQITDSLAVKLVLLDKKKNELAELIIGKTDYKQLPNPSGRPQYDVSTFVRPTKGKSVYTVDGSIGSTIRQPLQSWRDKYIFKFDKKNVESIELTNLEGGNFSIVKKDSIWQVENKVIEEKDLTNYLNKIYRLRGSSFAENIDIPTDIVGSVKVNCLDKSYTANIYKLDEKYYIESGVNKGVFFNTKLDSEINRMLVDKSMFKTKS
ncbi:MAG: DUF4340 domain-containing protein [Marinifilaceae bacterium]|jgi:hypothetical protein|nr:DUF4340 domain-containing protein [Marinifilaceae bacterium]